jgi:hypothetical protein
VNPRVVCVTWTDAHGNAFAIYEQHELPHAPAIVKTYGVLLREDDAGVSLANEVFEGGNFRGVTFIPRGMIKEMVDVGRKRTVRNRKSQGDGQL